MKMNKTGFTLVELLVVLLIVAILAAIATPLYLQNANRARAAEAVAIMSQVRQQLREFNLNNNAYFDITQSNPGKLSNPIPDGVINADGSCTGCTAGFDGLSLDIGVVKYYSDDAFDIDSDNSGTVSDSTFQNPTNAVDFIILADGSLSDPCSGALSAGDSCATDASQVTDIDLKMDNSGRIYVTYNATAATPTWEQY